MKRRVLGLLLFLLIVPLFMGCDQTTTQSATTGATTLAPNTTTTLAPTGTDVTDPLTTTAMTTANETLYSQSALGTVTFDIYVSGDDPDTVEVETEYVAQTATAVFLEDDTLFGLLMENFTLTYEESTYGRYLTSIGPLVVEEGNQYIAFYINGTYAMTGVDATELHDGDVYTFKLETF